MSKQAMIGCQQGHHAVCQHRILEGEPSSCECRCHTTRMVICGQCGAELPFEETNEHTRTHK